MEIDDTLYSRQRYMLGDEAMKRLASSNVLLIGCNLLGVEIAKNLVLAGVKKLTLVDDSIASWKDVQSNFYIAESDLESQMSRSSITLSKLSELNPYVEVSTLSEIFVDLNNPEALKTIIGYQCIIMVDCSLNVQLHMDQFCRVQSPSIKFMSCSVMGVLGVTFCDFGHNFIINDVDGEECKEIFVGTISQSNPGIVTTLDSEKHGFQDGDYVVFKEIQGMVELNQQRHKITVTSPCSFTIGDTSSYSSYLRNGIATSLKISKSMNFKSLQEEVDAPNILDTSCGSSVQPQLLHLVYRILQKYQNKMEDLPKSSQKLLEDLSYFDEEYSQKLIQSDLGLILRLIESSQGFIPALSTTLGGVVAQETLKAVTGKYTPINQWLYLDAIPLLPSAAPSHIIANADSYEYLRLCVGSELVEALMHLKVFMVGCGAIGCEMLKNMALLGIGTGKEGGKIVVTDNDLIEKSNLNRQFLFRKNHIQMSKSKVACDVIRSINPSINVSALDKKVGVETEETIFSDSFFCEQDVIVNALDNVEARRYIDSRCVQNCKPLIESGTSGAKGHVQVVVPWLTESYQNQNDPVDEMIAYCTLKSFPAQSSHTVQWAKEKFHSHFVHKPEQYNKFWKSVRDECPDNCDLVDYLIDNLEAYEGNVEKAVTLAFKAPQKWSDCVSEARCLFEKYFTNSPLQLMHQFPIDCITEDGSLFWSSPKRPPSPLRFDPSHPVHMSFLNSYAFILACVYRIAVPAKDDAAYSSGIEEGLLNARVPKFVPSSKPIITEETVTKPEKSSDSNLILDADALKAKIQLLKSAPGDRFALSCQHFEKDEDSNMHVDFIAAASNLRSMVYDLPVIDRLEAKKIAGRIVPAIATTTSIIAGLATLQLLQVVKWKVSEEKSKDAIEQFRNTFLNTAIPLLVFSEPGPANTKATLGGVGFTIWDKIEVQGNQEYKLIDLMEHFKTKFNLIVSIVSCNNKLVYFSLLPIHKGRLQQPMRQLLNSSAQYVDLDVTFENDDDVSNDQIAPTIRYYL